jgi:tetratricopeptide (TPR) repeat protein
VVRYAALLSLVAACSGFQKPFTSPAHGGPPWSEVTTRHFVLRTDHDPETAGRAAANLERMFSLVSDLAFESRDLPAMKVEVTYFRRSDEAEVVARRRGLGPRSGFFLAGRRFDFERERMAVLSGDLTEDTRALMQHELGHFFIDYYYPQAPTWLHEGLALYIEAIQLDKGLATFGALPSSFVFYKGSWWVSCSVTGCRSQIPVSDATPVSQLLVMPYEDFHGKQINDRFSPEYAETAREETTHYASAYALVRLLLENPTFRPAAESYFARLRSGEHSTEAWRETVGRLPPATLEAEFRASLAPISIILRQTRYDPPASPPERVRILSEGETRMSWARLWDWDSEEGRRGAGAELDGAPSDQQASVEGVLVRAGWLASGKQTAAAKDMLQQALARSPDQPRLLTSLLQIMLESKGDLSASGFAELEARLAPAASTAGQFHALAGASLTLSRNDAAVAHERRALAVDPGCVSCLAFLAEALALQGHLAEALATVRLAQGVLHDGARSPALASQLRRYQKVLAHPAGVAAGATSAPASPCSEGSIAPREPHGHLPPGALRKIMADNHAALSACYDAGRVRNPRLAGRFTIHFTVETDGKVTDVRPTCATFPDPDVIACMVAVYRGLVFPWPQGGVVPVSTPLEFGP